MVVGSSGSLGERDADRVELRLEVADADPEEEPATAQKVEASDLFRQHQRVALRDDDDPGAEQHSLGRRRRRTPGAPAGRDIESVGSIGDGGTRGDGSATCSPAHQLS